MHEVVVVVIAVVVGSALGGVVFTAVQRRRLRALARRARVECQLRVTRGQVSGLGGAWHQGTAELQRGRIAFRRGLPGGRGVRPGSLPVVVDVEAVEGRRRPRIGEWWGISPGCAILSVRCEGAVVEWVVLASQEVWAREQVAA